MRVRFLLGPAGSGKTCRCLAEAGQALAASPAGPPLLVIAPKQATYQLERQLLANPAVPGYTRLHILSFERLAHFIFDRLQEPPPEMLDEEGRLMVLRALLARRRDELKLFRASARLNGFARQLSLVLREVQRNRLTPEALLQLATQVQDSAGLAAKLQDLATLLLDYLHWLNDHNLQDADCLLAGATRALIGRSKTNEGGADTGLAISHLWMDGFAELSSQELELLAVLIPHCEQATLAFCLNRLPPPRVSWLSCWSVVHKTVEECHKRLNELPNASVSVEWLEPKAGQGRFQHSPALRHLERSWAEPKAAQPEDVRDLDQALRLAECANPEAEVTLAAREILRHVRAGGRYREVAVVVRNLELYHQPLQRIFSRYAIPFFLDRRESVSHHPLAELTRSALRTVAFQWQRDDWFAALKTGLVPATEDEIDQLENEALARGWQEAAWQEPVVIADQPELTGWLADMHRRLVPPFQRLARALAAHRNKPTGPQLAAALRDLWQALNAEQQLEEWAAAPALRSALRVPGSVHATVWEQMNGWLSNVELAFPAEAMPLREWLPILEAGLAGLTVGVIPPALDQVLLGAVDRSRNPDLKLALVLGLNETVFPAPPATTPLLTEADHAELEKHGTLLGPSARHQIGRERFYAYIACTRPRQRLVLTCAQRDADGAPLNRSPFLSRVGQLFPSLTIETVPQALDWHESEHVSELLVPLLRARGRRPGIERQTAEAGNSQVADRKVFGVHALACLKAPDTLKGGHQTGLERQSENCRSEAGNGDKLAELPALAMVVEELRHFGTGSGSESLAPELAERLYGRTLRTSVSRLEQFAACPFRFFVHSGLRAEERKRFELDVREQGSFQHDVLARFHEQLRGENKQWRDITPDEARSRIASIAGGLMPSYRDGLLQASEQSRFTARVLTRSLQDFVETLVGWMRRQYRFDPAAVEQSFGGDEGAPAWELPLEGGHRLALHGRIDRIDLCPEPETGAASCVVVDYKSGQLQLDPLLVEHGVQLQLLAYLNVLRHWRDPGRTFGSARLIPAGVFYVNLRGKYDRESNRLAALSEAEEIRKRAYRHTGRFDVGALRQLDARPDAQQGDQFNYRLTKSGQISKNCREPLSTEQFNSLLDLVETNLKQMGRQIYAGMATVDPYQKGSDTACGKCDYRSICRIDPWAHRYRLLKRTELAEVAPP